MGLATFTPGASPSSFTSLEIGGSTGDIAGPFPRYNISTETLRSDAVDLGQRYNITISGTAVIVEAASMLVEGERQSSIHKIIAYITNNIGNSGNLTITPYGGTSTITFNDCVLLSMDAPEQDDISQGVQSQDYTFTFEAYRMQTAVDGGSPIGTDDVYGDPAGTGNEHLLVQEYSENWSCQLVDGQVTGDLGFGNDVPKEPVYSISQSISATGKRLDDGKASYLNAKTFVDARLADLGDDPLDTVKRKDAAITPQDIALELPGASFAEYTAYNHLYTYNKDIQGGTYSVERTWIASKQLASMTIEFSNNIDSNAEANTVGVNLVVTGLDSSKSATTSSAGSDNNKYDNAVAFVNTITSTFLALWASNAYTGAGSLNLVPVSTSRTDNKGDGVITINQTYDDKEISVDFPCATSQTVTINDSNADGGNNIVAVLAVIAKSDGPVIQNMQTTGERTRSITLDLQIKKEDSCRDTKPSGIDWIENNYKPEKIVLGNDTLVVYRQSASDSWSPSNGSYSATVDYIWTADTPTN